MRLRASLRWFWFLLLASTILVTLFIVRRYIDVRILERFISNLGLWAPTLFIMIYAVAVVLFLPGTILTISGGLIFGPYWGTVYNISGAVMGATLAFVIARYLAADWVVKRSQRHLQTLLEGVAKEGWRFVAVIRLTPLIPFNLLNYALGLTEIKLLHYVIASAVFMLPACFAYTYVGSLGMAMITEEKLALLAKIFFAIGLIVIVAYIPWLVNRFRAGRQKKL